MFLLVNDRFDVAATALARFRAARGSRFSRHSRAAALRVQSSPTIE